MSSVRLRFDGLNDLRAALRRLPAELASEAQAVVTDAAAAAAAEVQAANPIKTGNLQSHVTVAPIVAGRWGAAVLVKSTATAGRTSIPLQNIVDSGTQVRRTSKGANRGQTKRKNILVPIVMRHRARMEAALRAIVVRAGFTLRG
jgi:hypothetical protein